MKKLIAALMALMMAVLCAAAFAEEPAADTEKEAVGMFDSAWASGYAELKAYYMDGYWKIEIAYGGFLWDYICVYDPELKALTADTNEENTKTSIAYDEEGSETGRTVEYTDGDAVFTLNEEGYLLWEDKKEDAGAGFEFEKIGWYPGEYACGEYTMSIYWDCEEPAEGEIYAGYKVEIEKAEGTGSVYWTYTAFYSPEDGILRAPIGTKDAQELQEGPFLTVYDDGAAEFALDEQGNVTWKDEKENAGEGLVFVLSNG